MNRGHKMSRLNHKEGLMNKYKFLIMLFLLTGCGNKEPTNSIGQGTTGQGATEQGATEPKATDLTDEEQAQFNEQLLTAAKNGNLTQLKEALDKGADINAKHSLQGLTALMWASHKVELRIVETLLNKGADVHVKDKYGNTALWWAMYPLSKTSNTDVIINLLKEKGATE